MRKLLILLGTAAFGLAACGGDYDKGFDAGFRQGSRLSAQEGGWVHARAELESAIEAGWICEVTLYESIKTLRIGCEGDS